ncbi:MAG: dihydroneopterin aldolase [Pigmentiphaga sp.]|nr:dihydroneopterin aldolase [Pigmentiphaga sp.]
MRNRRIFFEQIAVDARIGILDHELNATQPLLIDAEFDLHVKQAPQHDGIDEVLDYRALRQTIIDECRKAHVNLLETLCDRLERALLQRFPDVHRIWLRIAKPQAFDDCRTVGIEFEVRRGEQS